MHLTDEFIAQYTNKTVPFGNNMGHFVYLRTYSRWLNDQMRRETWQETCKRVVEYSLGNYQGPATFEELQKEAERMYDAMFNLRMFTSGRTLWIGGTEAERRFGTANFNCAFVVVDRYDAFVDAFHLLMVGCGVGFRILQDDVNKLPNLNAGVVIAHKPYHAKPKLERIEDTQVYSETDDKTGKTSVYIIVGDSKTGWVTALEEYLHAIQRNDVESIMVNYDSVRPRGEPLKTFGGRASGHQALKNMFRAIHEVVKESGGKLTPIHALDIMNHIGANVVVGGVRRTAQIALFDVKDLDVLNAKVDLWIPGSANYGNDQRGMSNNSIFFESKPTKETLIDVFHRIWNIGEPKQTWA